MEISRNFLPIMLVSITTTTQFLKGGNDVVLLSISIIILVIQILFGVVMEITLSYRGNK